MRDTAIRGELDSAITDVEDFSGNVSFPETLRVVISIGNVEAQEHCQLRRRTVMPSCRAIATRLEMVPLYIGPLTSRCDRGSDREWICSCSRIFTTSRGAMQNLDFVSVASVSLFLRLNTSVQIPRNEPGYGTCGHHLSSIALLKGPISLMKSQSAMLNRLRCIAYLIL